VYTGFRVVCCPAKVLYLVVLNPGFNVMAEHMNNEESSRNAARNLEEARMIEFLCKKNGPRINTSFPRLPRSFQLPVV
jgi:hypothetical protein